MTRIEEAKELRKQGFKPREIAEKMGVKLRTVYVYLYTKPEHYFQKIAQRFGTKVRSIIHEELSSFGLPLEWEDEVFKMFMVYHIQAKEG